MGFGRWTKSVGRNAWNSGRHLIKNVFGTDYGKGYYKRRGKSYERRMANITDKLNASDRIKDIEKDIADLRARRSSASEKEQKQIDAKIARLQTKSSRLAKYTDLSGEKKKKFEKELGRLGKRADRNQYLLDTGKWDIHATKRLNRDKEGRKLEKLERKKEKAYEKHGITTTEALTSMFKRERDLTGLRGRQKREAKRYNKRLALLRQKNSETFGKVKDHIGRNLGAYGIGAAALLGGGALLANNAHKRSMMKMAYNNQMAKRNANYKLIGDIAGSVISGMRGGQQPYLGGAGVYGYNPYQQQQQPKKRSLVGSIAKVAASNPALAQVALGAASKFMG